MAHGIDWRSRVLSHNGAAMNSSLVDSQSAVEDYELALRTALLEKEYEATLRYTSHLVDAERSRASHVESLLLQFENEALQNRLEQTDREVSNLIDVEYQARCQLYEASQELDEVRKQSRLFSKEIATLRNELISQKDDRLVSTDLSAEVSRLSKELSESQVEIDRLRSQKAASSASIPEKKVLERQLNTLEVQLENEKRAHERALTKISRQTDDINVLSSTLDQARRDLAKEIDARSQQDRVLNERYAQWETERITLEGRLQALSKKSRSSSDQSQIVQVKQNHQHENPDVNGTGTAARSRPIIQQSMSRLNPDIMIATPGAVRAQTRKTKAPTMPGDKSSFSITPFLNRTKGVQNSPLSSDNETDELHSIDPGIHVQAADTSNSSSQVQENHVQPYVDEVSNSKPLSDDSKQQSEKALSGLNLPRGAQDRQPSISNTDDRLNGSSVLSSRPLHGHAKARKRKLGTQRDQSIFDDEDDDDGLQGMKKPGRKLAGSGRNPGLQSSVLTGALSRGRGFGAMAEFSPLKRDKKRV